jgi:hypothetical protein
VSEVKKCLGRMHLCCFAVDFFNGLSWGAMPLCMVIRVTGSQTIRGKLLKLFFQRLQLLGDGDVEATCWSITGRV